MVKFEVNYNGKWYKYESGWIHESIGFDAFHPFIAICDENLFEQMEEPYQRVAIEIALHTYFQGVVDGKQEKIQELKRCLKIDD